MTVMALQAAKHLARHNEWNYSHLQLQKLIYLSHMYHLVHEEKRLVYGHFEAWRHGPVHPELYFQLRGNGAEPIPEKYLAWVEVEPVSNDSSEAKWLNRLSNQFPPSKTTGSQLRNITHNKFGAWKKRYVPDENVVITKDDIINEYQALLNEQERRRKQS